MGTYSDPALILPGTVGQTELDAASKKDVASGVAALNAAGALLVAGSKIYYTRDGSDDVHIYERTSDEEAYAFHRVGANDYTLHVKESNVWKQFQTESMKDIANGIAGLDASTLIPDALLASIIGRVVYIPYTGDGNANRALAHTLGVTPKIAIGTREHDLNAILIEPDNWQVNYAGSTIGASVTAMDSTNIYLDASYMNSGTKLYHMVVIG